ncbi:polysaccharide pyruvyl transferase family protein [Pluralibacter gergoviae]|uniref:Polysaccharide pyruvyl transferase family protein n=1 Tax=Pluralibacter gergoviae TaxID=61647 RepID=A0AAW8HND1_PLUGE|nr:polysaccharide pyruvyl transferase family protein [Pluralibacter gergoviae]AVR05020.1 hypothetical protein A8H26_21145 [Pluralibacter gergoviae]MDQ2309078.1 polysaccharide pyruvyl transferase family protein [Pluralibacter gergoviae]
MKFKQKLINKLKGKVNDLSHSFYKLPNDLSDVKIAYVLGVSNHPNAGDQEITLAQKKFINQHLPDHLYIEIEKEKTKFIIDELALRLKTDDFVFIQGGGTFSDLYPEHELPRQLIIKKLKDAPCKIIQFPISFYYDNLKEFQDAKKFYNNAKNLTLFVRESKSYKCIKQYLETPSFHIPDIVLSQDESDSQVIRGEQILIMFRNDCECLISKDLANDIIEYFSKKHQVTLTDNYVENNVLTFEFNREELLKLKFDEFRKAKLIITDRLHGMIFAYITKTPVIVFDNSYGKVKFSYQDWLADCDYIVFLDSTSSTVNDVIAAAEKLINSKRVFSLNVNSAFNPLIDVIRK